MQDELINSYMQVINESDDLTKTSEVKGATKPSHKPFGSDCDADLNDGNESDEFVDLEKPTECKSAGVKDGNPKKVAEASNPFDDLYNKIVKENSFNFTTEVDDLDDEMESEFEVSGEDDLDDEGSGNFLDDESDELSDESDDSEEVDLKVLVAQLTDVLSQLEKIVGDDDSDDDSDEDIDDSDEDIDDIEDLEDESDEDESFSDFSDDSDDDDEVKEEGYKRKEFEKNKKLKDKKKLFVKKPKANVAEEAVNIKNLKKGANLKSFSGNIKTLQNKKAEVTGNNPKPNKSKAKTPATGTGYNGVPTKISPTAGHNLMKAASHQVSGAVKTGKGLFDQ